MRDDRRAPSAPSPGPDLQRVRRLDADGDAGVALPSGQRCVRPRHAPAAARILGEHAEEVAAAGDENGTLRALQRARFAYDFADHTNEQAWVRFVTPYRTR